MTNLENDLIFEIFNLKNSQFEELLNILSIQIISEKWTNKFDYKTIEYLIYRYFNVRNFEISKC